MLSLAVPIVGPLGGSTVLADDSDRRSKLDKESRERLAAGVASGQDRVMLLIATKELASPSVVASLQGLGASIRYHDSEVGYIRASVPTANVDRATKLAGVRAAEIDFVIPLVPPRPDAEGAGTQTSPPPPPGAATAPQNAYMPTRDIGAPQFVAANPTFDGRGITIGILDTGVDLEHPALQTTSTGERKIVEWVTFTHPTDDGDPTWLIMSQTVEVDDGTFTVGGVTYTGAPDGRFRFGVFEEASLGPENLGNEYAIFSSCGSDLNRNGVCNEKFAVLWDEGKDSVIIDTNADKSFAGESAMRPYKKAFDVGRFGTDNPATEIREAVPFVVQIDRAFSAVNIGIVSGSHGSHVAGIAAGNDFFGGAFDGAAPGAKIVSVRVCLFISGCTAHALIEGMIFAIKEAGSDVVNMSIGGLPALNDGNNPRAIIYNELIDKRGVQMFISAGNSGSGINTVGDPSVATKVMSVAAYWSKPTVHDNYGNDAVSDEALHDFSSRGPREDGFTKPQIAAPGSAVSAVPRWQPQQCLAYICAVGHGMFNGTSMAAPQAAGAGALLLSAAKQSGVGHKPAQLRQALMSSSSFIPGYKAHEQGTGLIKVGPAWSLLSQDIKTAEISSAVATNTILSPFLATPGIGAGIHEREGLTTGQSKTRTYTFSRSDGGRATFNVSFVGDAAAFSASASQVTIDKGSPATLDVTFNAQATAGVFSALLRLDDPATVGFDYQIMNTVVVHNALNAANAFTRTVAGTAKRFESNQLKFFVNVPAGTTALQVQVTRTNNGRIRFQCIDPRGIPQATATCGAGFFGPLVPPGSAGPESRTSTVANPRAGVWEITVIASRSAIPPTSTFNVKATVFKVGFTPASWTNSPTVVGTTYMQSFTAANQFAAGTIGTTGSPFASTRTLTPTIAAGAPPQTFPFSIPAGTTRLTVGITQGSDPAADLDLYVFDPSGTLRGSGTGATATETVTITGPDAGTWTALVDPFDVPAGSTTYGYTDSFVNTAFGSVTANTPFVNRASGSTFTVSASGSAASNPGPGRFLRASVDARLTSATGPILGSAGVEFRGFAP